MSHTPAINHPDDEPDHPDTHPDHPGNPPTSTAETCRICSAEPDHPDEVPDHPDDAQIIRTPIRITRPLPAWMTWAKARVPIRPLTYPFSH